MQEFANSGIQAHSVSFFRQFSPVKLPASYRKKTFDVSVFTHLSIALFLNILSLALPIMMLQVYDRIIPYQSYGSLIVLITGVLIALALDVTLRIIRSYLISWSAASHEYAASCAAIDNFSSSDLVEFEKNTVGGHLQNLTALGRLREFYTGQAWTALIDLPFALIFIGLIYYLGHELVFVPIGLLICFILVSVLTGRNLHNALQSRQKTDHAKSSFVVSVLSGIHTVKSLAMETFLLRRFEAAQQEVSKDSFHVAEASGLSTIISAAFGQLSLILTATFGFFLVLNGQLSVGGLSACTLLAGRCIQPVQRVLGTWLRFQDLSVSHQQAEELFSIPTFSRTTETVMPSQGRVTIDHMSYTDMEDNRHFQNISFNTKRGDFIALIGNSELSKTIFMQLILGLRKPEKGTIRIDDIDPSQYSLSDLQEMIGYISPHASIYKGTILNNLTGFNNDDRYIEQAKEAAKSLGIDKVVEIMPYGYNTLLQDSASDPIPPGVKQRLSMARIFARKPAIILFDNAHHTLDKDGYNLLYKLMGKLKGRTTIIITTNDQNLLSLADSLFNIDDGKVTILSDDKIKPFAFQ